jgi:hypothetical protein
MSHYLRQMLEEFKEIQEKKHHQECRSSLLLMSQQANSLKSYKNCFI